MSFNKRFIRPENPPRSYGVIYRFPKSCGLAASDLLEQRHSKHDKYFEDVIDQWLSYDIVQFL